MMMVMMMMMMMMTMLMMMRMMVMMDMLTCLLVAVKTSALIACQMSLREGWLFAMPSSCYI
eukprot:4807807-Karenia_brevis.AAC.1